MNNKTNPAVFNKTNSVNETEDDSYVIKTTFTNEGTVNNLPSLSKISEENQDKNVLITFPNEDDLSILLIDSKTSTSLKSMGSRIDTLIDFEIVGHLGGKLKVRSGYFMEKAEKPKFHTPICRKSSEIPNIIAEIRKAKTWKKVVTTKVTTVK